MKRIAFLIASFVLITQIGFSQSIDKAKLDSYFKTLEDDNRFMGSVAISQDGKLVYTKAVGFSDVETKIKANENTKYKIGSISKTFTAVLVFKALEENKLSLTETIGKYFPSIQHADKITISQLLGHRSGIYNYTNNPDNMKLKTKKHTERELLEVIAKGGSDFEPDSKVSYSNSNYILLTFILQKVYNKHISVLLKEKITTPLALKSTYFSKPIDVADNESNSYTFNGSWIKDSETDMSVALGAGAIVSKPTDLLKFADALFNGKLISMKNLELMETIRDGYGMGLFPLPFYDKRGYGHTGGIDKFTSVFGYFPEGKVAYALTSNGSSYNNNTISIALLSSVYNKPYDVPVFYAAEDLGKYLGVYSSTSFPLKITITKNDKTLVGQASGQSAFPLEATEKDKFKFDQANLVLEFQPLESKMILKQGGGVFTFSRE
jgi:D-alanyl-D-alanine carboxypeptidase